MEKVRNVMEKLIIKIFVMEWKRFVMEKVRIEKDNNGKGLNRKRYLSE